MSRLDWQFIGHPEVDTECGKSDRVILKLSDGVVMMGTWDGKEWCADCRYPAKVCCWAYVGKVPDTTRPMR